MFSDVAKIVRTAKLLARSEPGTPEHEKQCERLAAFPADEIEKLNLKLDEIKAAVTKKPRKKKASK